MPTFITDNPFPQNLPLPSPEAIAHSNKLTELIMAEIAIKQVTFSHFMELALYAPGLGYYSAGAQKFGKAGDFITAPEISPLFAQCIARQCQQVFSELTSPIIFEVGAGSGALCADLLLALDAHNALPEKYWILAVSAQLKEKQQQLIQQRCPQLFERVVWLNQLPDAEFNGVIVANELLDAMPVNLFQWHNNNINELFVTVTDNQFQLQPGEPISANLSQAVTHIQNDLPEPLPQAYTSEVNLLLQAWFASITEKLQKGLVLLIDYGFARQSYYHPQRDAGTLMCHYRHHAHPDPFIFIGLQDITAHVDFTHVAEVANAAGMTVAGFTSQAYFLLSCGITELLTECHDADSGANTAEHYAQAQQIKQLTLPSEMGELFKVIALTQDLDIPLLGFQMQNQLHLL